MRRAWDCGLVIFSAALILWPAPAHSQEVRGRSVRAMAASGEQHALRENADPALAAAAAVDTYTIVYYSFGTLNWQGWTRVDNMAQVDTFWHVEDYLEPELADLPGPLEGTKSVWCGAPPGPASYICSWRSAPGYGNGWNQYYGCKGFNIYGQVSISYRIRTDLEPGHDFVRVYYWKSYREDWIEIASYTGETDITANHTVNSTLGTKFRFRFTSDWSGSDEDGLFDSNGAAHIDSITIKNWGEVVSYEDFESGTDGWMQCGDWGDYWSSMDGLYGYGRYSRLQGNLQDLDPCNDNLTTQIAFFDVSSGSYHCISAPGYAGLCTTPYCHSWSASRQNEMVVSPVIDLTKYSTAKNNSQDASFTDGELATLGPAHLSFTVYKDLPPENLVFYMWRVRGVDASGCARLWSAFLGASEPGERPGYERLTFNVGALTDFRDSAQVALGVVDMCDAWYGGTPCTEHTPAPWFDNVEIKRFYSPGPQWSYWAGNLFQDNFPEQEFNIESFVRADAAVDINPPGNPAIRPGDSIAVECRGPHGDALGLDPAGGAAVYMHVKCSYIGATPLKPVLAGPALQGTYGAYRSDDGTWTVIQGDSARTSAGVSSGSYMFDLNDSLFTRGYTIEYYFTARDAGGLESALPRYARTQKPYFEWTALPALKGRVLFVDDSYDATGGPITSPAEYYWNYALAGLPYNEPADRYHVNCAPGALSNGPGSRAKWYPLTSSYDVIVWECGDLAYCTLSDGTTESDKSNDCMMLVDWINLSEHNCGLWVCGDNAASDLMDLASPSAIQLLYNWCGAYPVSGSYFDLTGGASGGVVNPLVSGEIDLGVYVHGGNPDEFYAYGGCPVMNRFDVLEKTSNGKYALGYPDYGGNQYHAAIGSLNYNSAGYAARTMWFGFSYQYIRNDGWIFGRPERVHIAEDTFSWMQSPLWYSGEESVPLAYRLAQNFPNPFNPATTIRYDMRAKGLVTIKIYDVSGRLVRTLLDGVKEAGSYAAAWDGGNNLGAAAASGIYFCKMQTAGFSDVKKLVLLR